MLAALAADPLALVLIAPLEGIGFACVFVGGVTVLAAHAPASLRAPPRACSRRAPAWPRSSARSPAATIAGAIVDPGAVPVGAAVSLVGTGIVAIALLGPGTGRIGAGPSRGPA